jgi:hypothetical protein
LIFLKQKKPWNSINYPNGARAKIFDYRLVWRLNAYQAEHKAGVAKFLRKLNFLSKLTFVKRFWRNRLGFLHVLRAFFHI